MGVRLSKMILSRTTLGSSKFIDSTLRRAKYFSLSFGGRIWPDVVSPVLKPNFFICEGET